MEIKVQKDAAGSISPLRVRIGSVWVPGASFGPVFGVFRFSGKSVFEIRVQKDAPGPVSHHSGSNFRSLGSGSL